MVITHEENAWLLTTEDVEKLPNCNHHEADTRIIAHAIPADTPVVVVASDTDILILLVYAYHKFMKETGRQVQMKIDTERFVNIKTIAENLPEDAINCLPAYHSITGCDTTSYPFGVGKVRPWTKALKKKKIKLLEDLEKENTEGLDAAETFVKTIMYPGKETDSVVDTRSKMYEKQKQKASSSLIPDPDSLNQHLKRARLQTMIWTQSGQQNIDYPNPTEYGWVQEDGLKPLWFVGPQLPPSLTRASRKRKHRVEKTVGYDADTEESDAEEPVPKKPVRTSRGQTSQGLTI